MANSKDITSLDGNVLIIGDGGTHKTRFLADIPGIYIFDFDKGMASTRDKSVEYDTFKDLARERKATPATEKLGLYDWGTGWEKFTGKFYSVMDKIEKGTNPPLAIGLDSLTTMSMLAINKILKDTGHASPHQGTWGAHHEYFKTIFSMGTALPIRFICTAHIHRDENDLTKVTEKLPLLAGKLAGLINIFFDEVWYTDTDKGKIVVRTNQTPMLKSAKSRWGVPDGTELTWEALKKYLEVK